MRIQASVGKAPKNVSLKERVYSLKLIAETEGEKQWLAGLLKVIRKGCWGTILRGSVPELSIVERKDDGKGS